MADSAETPDASTPKYGAPKDKNCPYCGQAFTSSSLGRHLDLYIKEKNPKPPDGIHDVDAIKKIRGGITRRQARGSMGGRREVSQTPTGTPKASRKEMRTASDPDTPKAAKIPKDGQYVVDSALSKFPFAPRWEATGVINDLPSQGLADREASIETSKRPTAGRTVSKQMVQKAQFDVKQKLADAMDTARAAELALREIIGSWRSAKQEIDNKSMPFDFEPLSLDFPALTLQCLEPPPTLFSSTQHATSTSWSVQSPGKREFSALQSYFDEAFRAWTVTCASATTAVTEELVTLPTGGSAWNVREAVKKAERSAANLEQQVTEHLESAFAVWETLPEQRRTELWVLELARGVGRKQKDIDKFKDEQHRLKQENAHLKSQVDHLNRLQQPREFKLLSPTTFPLDRDLIATAYGAGVRGAKSIGFDVEDRQFDLATVVARSIGRWKSVITSTRASSAGMTAQKPLEQAASPAASGSTASPQQTQRATLHKPSMSQSVASQAGPSQEKRLSVASTNDQASEQTTQSATTTAPPSVADSSDQDADAEMEDDDSFAMMDASPAKQPQLPMQQQAQLDVPRTRAQVQQQNPGDVRFMMPNTGGGNQATRNAMAMSRSMPNMAMAMQSSTMQDISMAMQGVRGDMYME